MSRKRTDRQQKLVEGVLRGKSVHRAALDAGYAPSSAKSYPYNSKENSRIIEAIERRKEQARKAANIETEVILGQLNEIATSSLTDVLDESGEFDIEKARENGTDHLIKKLKVKTRYIPNGAGKEPDKEVTHEYEMYSRLDAISQLRDSVGLKVDSEQHPADVSREKDKVKAEFIKFFIETVRARHEQNPQLSLAEISLQVRSEMEVGGMVRLVKILPELGEENG